MRISDWSSDVCSSDLASGVSICNSVMMCQSLEYLYRRCHGRPAASKARPNARPGAAGAPLGYACLDRIIDQWKRGAVPPDHVTPISFKRIEQVNPDMTEAFF